MSSSCSVVKTCCVVRAAAVLLDARRIANPQLPRLVVMSATTHRPLSRAAREVSRIVRRLMGRDFSDCSRGERLLTEGFPSSGADAAVAGGIHLRRKDVRSAVWRRRAKRGSILNAFRDGLQIDVGGFQDLDCTHEPVHPSCICLHRHVRRNHERGRPE